VFREVCEYVEMVKVDVAFPFAGRKTLVGFIEYDGHPIARQDAGGVRLTVP